MSVVHEKLEANVCSIKKSSFQLCIRDYLGTVQSVYNDPESIF